MTTRHEGFACGHCGKFAKFAQSFEGNGIHMCSCGARTGLERHEPIWLLPPRACYLATGLQLDAFGEGYGVRREFHEADADYRERIIKEVTHTYPKKGTT